MEVIRVSADGDDDGGERDIAVQTLGDPSGTPIFLLHGTPGSRHGPVPRASVLYRLGIRLICYDRPGYGRSGRYPGRRVVDAAWDVLEIAQHLGLDEFAVVGRSGGGPHALACAAQLPQVRCAAVLVGLAPSEADRLNWYQGMSPSNVEDYGNAESDPDQVMASLRERTGQVQRDPENLLRILLPELTGHDRKVIDDIAIYQQLMRTYEEALRVGPDGWIDDVLAFKRPWGFDLSKIESPVLLWHGEDDVFTPVSHTSWLERQIPHAFTEIRPGAAHFDALKILPRILVRVKDTFLSEGLRV